MLKFFIPNIALGPNNLLDVLTELLDVSADWYKVGLALKLTPGTLNAMKGPHKEPKDCMMDMVSEWLSTSPDPSWEGLIAALRHPVVGKVALARQLEAKYCPQAPPQGKDCKPYGISSKHIYYLYVALLNVHWVHVLTVSLLMFLQQVFSTLKWYKIVQSHSKNHLQVFNFA